MREKERGVRKGRGEGEGRKMERERNIYVLRHSFLAGYFLLILLYMSAIAVYWILPYLSAIVLDKLMYSHTLSDLYWY